LKHKKKKQNKNILRREVSVDEKKKLNQKAVIKLLPVLTKHASVTATTGKTGGRLEERLLGETLPARSRKSVELGGCTQFKD
jgi:hypothetical protein